MKKLISVSIIFFFFILICAQSTGQAKTQATPQKKSPVKTQATTQKKVQPKTQVTPQNIKDYKLGSSRLHCKCESCYK
jgi:hypothetical protein